MIQTALLGIPSDVGSSYRRGAAGAPAAIRAEWARAASYSNRTAEDGTDLGQPGVHRAVGTVDVVHLDAHPDLYPDFEGNRYSHACPFARALEDGLVGRLVQPGVLQRIEGRVIAADLVEYNPDQDHEGATAIVAAKLLKELIACLAR